MTEWLPLIRFTPLTIFFQGLTFLANEEFLYIFLPVVYWCWRKRSGAHLFILVILTAYINFLLKNLFGWERPPSDLWLVDAGGFGFPSSHAALITAIWGYLAYSIRKRFFTISAISIIILVSVSRIYLGVHYPQDVIAGASVGAIILHLYRWLILYSAPRLSKVNDIIKIIGIILISLFMYIIQSDYLTASAAGLFAGIGSGFIIEPHLADFTPSDRPYRKVFKSVLALLILTAFWQALEWLFPHGTSFKWFQYFLVGIWITATTPWIFIQLRLAYREP